MLVNKFHSILSFTSQKVLYNSLLFYDISYFSNFKQLEIKNIISFRQFLVKSLFLSEFYMDSLTCAQLICVNNSFSYLDAGRKITLVKPKLKKFREIFTNSEVLLIWNKPFFKIMLNTMLKNFVKELFQYNSIKFKSFKPCINETFLVKSFCLKKLSACNKYLKEFLIVELKKNSFSIFQKKINFIQLNVLFRKLYLLE